MFNIAKSNSKGQIINDFEAKSSDQSQNLINEDIYLTNYQKKQIISQQSNDQLKFGMQDQNLNDNLFKINHSNQKYTQGLSRSGSNLLISQQAQNPISNKYFFNQDEVVILIEDFKFQPTSLYVHSGTKLTWQVKKNKASYNSIYDSSGPRFFIISIPQLEEESSPIHENESFSYIIEQLGTFDIICPNYTRMKGSVIVVDKQNQQDLSREQNSKVCFMEHIDEFRYSQNLNKIPQQLQINSSINKTKEQVVQKSINLKNENIFSTTKIQENQKNINGQNQDDQKITNQTQESKIEHENISDSLIKDQQNHTSQIQNINCDIPSQNNSSQQDHLKQSSKQEKILTKIIDQINQESSEQENIAKQFMKELQEDQDNQPNKKKNAHYLQLYKDDFQEEIDEDEEEDDDDKLNSQKQTMMGSANKKQQHMSQLLNCKETMLNPTKKVSQNEKAQLNMDKHGGNMLESSIKEYSSIESSVVMELMSHKIQNQEIDYQKQQSKLEDLQCYNIQNQNILKANTNIDCQKPQNNQQVYQNNQELEYKQQSQIEQKEMNIKNHQINSLQKQNKEVKQLNQNISNNTQISPRDAISSLVKVQNVQKRKQEGYRCDYDLGQDDEEIEDQEKNFCSNFKNAILKKNEATTTNNIALKGNNPQIIKYHQDQFGFIEKNNEDDEFNNDEDEYQYDCSTIISEEDTSVYTSKENSLVYRRNNSSSNLCSSGGGVAGQNLNPNNSFTASQTLNKHLKKRVRRNYNKKPKIGILSESYLKSPAQSILTTAESSKYSDTTKQLSQKGDFEIEGNDIHERGGLLFQHKYSQKRRASTDQTIQESRYLNSNNNEDSDTRSIRSLKNEPNTINNSNINQNNNNGNNNVCCGGFGCSNASCGTQNYLKKNQNHFTCSSESDNESEWADLFQNCNNVKQTKNQVGQNSSSNVIDSNKFETIKQQSKIQFLNFTENISKQNQPKRHLKKQINSQILNQSTGSLEGLSENREESKSFSSQNTNSLSPQKHVCNKTQQNKKLIENYKQNTNIIQSQLDNISSVLPQTNEKNQSLQEQISFMQQFLEQSNILIFN